MRKGVFRVFLVVALGFAKLACDNGGNSSDGSTSWLNACSVDADCRSSRCLCGVCTLACGSGAECGKLPSTAACIDVSASNARCSLEFGGNGTSLCLPPCGASGRCPQTLTCVAGVCAPDALLADGGGPTLSDSGGVGSSSDAGAGGRAGSVGANGGANGGANSGKGGGGGVLSSLDADVQLQRPPFDAGTNPYGEYLGLNSNPTIECGPESMNEIIQVGDAPDNCTDYGLCNLPCTSDRDCPAVPGASAKPVCRASSTCALSCGRTSECPFNMSCREDGRGGKVCEVVFPVTSPGCPAHCQLDPIPRDCPNWCAAAGVACDPSKGQKCCANLLCNDLHYCIPGGT